MMDMWMIFGFGMAIGVLLVIWIVFFITYLGTKVKKDRGAEEL